jgi:hypothetical protein
MGIGRQVDALVARSNASERHNLTSIGVVMAKIQPQTQRVMVEASFTINEQEMRALDALFGYGVDGLLKVFYQHLGTHYMKPYEAGLRSLCDAVRSDVPGILHRVNDARKAFEGA